VRHNEDFVPVMHNAISAYLDTMIYLLSRGENDRHAARKVTTGYAPHRSILNNKTFPVDVNRNDVVGRFAPLFRESTLSKESTYLYAVSRCTRTDGDVRFATRYVLEAGGRRESLHDLVGQSQCVFPKGCPSRNDVLRWPRRQDSYTCLKIRLRTMRLLISRYCK